MANQTNKSVKYGISIADIRRALANGGDVSFLAPVIAKALANPPIPIASSLEVPLPLPDPDLLLTNKGDRFRELLRLWREEKEFHDALPANTEIIFLPVPPRGRNVAGFISKAIDEIKPDTLAVDAAPVELASAMLYTFSVPAALGRTVYTEVRLKEDSKPYGSRIIFPGGFAEEVIVRGWAGQIPIVPIGKPYVPGHSALKTADEDVVDEEMTGINLRDAWDELDGLMENTSDISMVGKTAERTGLSLANLVSIHINHKIMREAGYAASRIFDLASFANNPERRTRILAVIDIKHYPAIKRYLELLMSGAEADYARPENPAPQPMMMLGRHASANLPGEPVPNKTPLQTLFERALGEWSEAKQREVLSQETIDRSIVRTMERLRTHPLVQKGASVRGSLGFKEVLDSLAALNSRITCETMEKAAIITLPSRLKLKPGTKENKEGIVIETVKEVLYGIEFYRTVYQVVAGGNNPWLAPEDINRLLDSLSKEKKTEGSNKESADELLKALEAQKLLRRALGGEYVLTAKSIERLLEDLEVRSKENKLSKDEYEDEKSRLEGMLKEARATEVEISPRELAGMVMDFMDVIDKGFEKEWGKDINFLRLFLYYRAMSKEGQELAPWQKEWGEIKNRLDNMEKRGILKVTPRGTERTVSGLALTTLLGYLEPRNDDLKKLRESTLHNKNILSLRSEEIRTLTASNTYRDISFRHTLKEVARKKKPLSEVRQSDFRVYIKPQRLQHTDIVLCLDTSGSMAEHRKMTYARLAAAAINGAAAEGQDRVAVVSFEDTGRTSIPFGDDNHSLVNDYLATLGAVGGTNIGDGIKCAVDLLTRDYNHNKKRIYLITDGEPNAISEKALKRLKDKAPGDLTEEAALVETRRAAARGITLSVIYMAAEKRKGDSFVRNLARAGKGRVIMINCKDEERGLKDTRLPEPDFQEYR